MKTSEPSFHLDTLRTALEGGEFFLEYQPIVSIPDGRCIGAEALVRWRQSADLVRIASQFMPGTDGTPLSGTITYWVMDTVAAELLPWLTLHPDAFVSINVPPEILGRGGLEYAARKSGLRSHVKQLVLEVTERGIPDQLGLDALRAMPFTGARLALDDVKLDGTHLALLLRCPFDYIKLDAALIAELVPGAPQPEWLQGLAALLEATKLKVIAEGVETPYQVGELWAAGVPFAQGHQFSLPRKAPDFMGYYAHTNRPV